MSHLDDCMLFSGELTSDEQIAYFTSSGPKSYSYLKLRERSYLESKDFTLNAINSNFVPLWEFVFGINPDNDAPRMIIIEQCPTVRNKEEWGERIQTPPDTEGGLLQKDTI